MDPIDVCGAHTAARQAARFVDLGAIGQRLLDSVQMSHHVDRRPPLRAARTRLRWAATSAGRGNTAIRYTVESDGLRTLRLAFPEIPDIAAVPALCEDIAAHDWLLTMLVEVVDRSMIEIGPPAQVLERLRPAIHHLLHLWMPAARVHPSVAAVWEALERRPGFTRQWESLTQRIRDYLTMCSFAAGPVFSEVGPVESDRSMPI